MNDAPSRSSVSALSWLVGSWQARIPGLPNDCPVEARDLVSVLDVLSPWAGTMPAIWRVGGGALTLVSIREVEETLEWTEQEYSSNLQPRSSNSPLVYRLQAVDVNSATFETIGPVAHTGFRGLRMEFSAIDPGRLLLRFFRLNGDGDWSLAREALHERSSAA